MCVIHFLNSFVVLDFFVRHSLAYGFLITAFALQWSIIWLGLLEQSANTGEDLQKNHLSIKHLQSALYGATAVAISCGSVLGRLDPLQLGNFCFFF